MTPPPLVLVPGFGSDAALWSPVVRSLGDAAEYRVGDTLRDDSLPAMARRILDTAPPRFALAGVSMGGMVALEILRAAPERVVRLALLDTTARPDTAPQRMKRHAVNAVVTTVGPFDFLVRRGMGSLVDRRASAELRSRLAEMTIALGRTVFVRQNRALATRQDMRSLLPDIRVPVAVIVGANDRTTPVALSQELHRLIPGSTLDIVPDSAHLALVEQPDIVATVLRRWLERPALPQASEPAVPPERSRTSSWPTMGLLS